MSTTLLDVEAVRSRYTALQRRLAFFDGPGGTQCPDSVIDAIAEYLRHDNANVGAPYETSRRTNALVDLAHERAAAFLGCDARRGRLRAEHDVAQLPPHPGARPRAGPGRRGARHDASTTMPTSPRGSTSSTTSASSSATVDVTDELALDLESLESQLSARTRVVAFPVAANSVGTAPDVPRIAELAHSVGALAWADAVHFGPHGPIDVAAWDVDVLLCSPYKFFGPHMGMAFGRDGLLRSWEPYKVRPAADEPVGHRFELGTCQHELLAGLVAAIDYVDELGWDAITAHERALGQRFLDGLPAASTLHGLPTMEGRVPTFCFSVEGHTAEEVATHLATRDVAVWWGNYYALETIRHLGLDEHDGAVRAGIVHYNTADEVDRLLDGVGELL